jgi:tetratricopeptide (TPR) repeat protein
MLRRPSCIPLLAAAVAATLLTTAYPARAADDPASPHAMAGALLRQAARLNRVGDHSKAVALLTRALEVDPKMTEAYRERGTTYMSMAQAEETIAKLDRALAAAQRGEAAEATLRQRGEALYHVGRYREAAEDLTAALTRRPHDAETYYLRGLVYAAQGDGPKALADYERFLRLRRGIGLPSSEDETRARLL